MFGVINRPCFLPGHARDNSDDSTSARLFLYGVPGEASPDPASSANAGRSPGHVTEQCATVAQSGQYLCQNRGHSFHGGLNETSTQ